MGRRERPLAPGPLYDFAYDLRELRARTGLTYRELSREAGYTHSALSAAASGNCLPTADVLRGYVRACGGDTAAWEERRSQLLAELRRTSPGLLPAAAPEPECAVPPPGGPGEREAATVTLGELTAADPREIGPAVLAARLGAGAMGQVYLGRTASGEPAVVKVVRAELAGDQGFRNRFRREAEALAKVRSRFVARVTGTGPEAERPWLATAYTPALTLAEAVETGGPLPLRAVGQLASALASALAAMHRVGVVHRDLKPSNVLLTERGVQVIDFGVAHLADGADLSATGARLGNAAYMAPEQAAGTGVTPAADVFALGGLLAFALTGQPPFGEGRAEAVLYRIIHDDPDLSAVDKALASVDNNSGGLGSLIRACLDKDPARRPIPAAIADGYPPAASPPGPGWLPAAVTGLISRRATSAEQALARLPSPRPQTRRKTSVTFRRVRFGLAPLILAGTIIIINTILMSAQTPTVSLPPPSHHPSAPMHPPRTAPGVPVPRPAAPHLLGTPDYQDYCRATDQGHLEHLAGRYAYGWHCSGVTKAVGDGTQAVCAWTFRDLHLPASQITTRITSFYAAQPWQCWQVTRQLSPPNWDGYCRAYLHQVATHTSNVYGWACAGGFLLNPAAVCEWTNHTTTISRFRYFYNPSSWECWA